MLFLIHLIPDELIEVTAPTEFHDNIEAPIFVKAVIIFADIFGVDLGEDGALMFGLLNFLVAHPAAVGDLHRVDLAVFLAAHFEDYSESATAESLKLFKIV